MVVYVGTEHSAMETAANSATIDKRIATLLEELTAGKSIDVSVRKAKPILSSQSHRYKDLLKTLVKFFGVNLTSISGINSYTLLRLMGQKQGEYEPF